MQERYKISVKNLNNKSRKGDYVYIYDNKNKKASYYPYDSSIDLSYYIGYQAKNRDEKKSIRSRIRETKQKLQQLQKIERKQFEDYLSSEEKVIDFVKKNMRNRSYNLLIKPNETGFDVSKTVKKMYKEMGLTGEVYKKAIKNHKNLSEFSSSRIVFYGDNYTTHEKNVYLGHADYVGISLEELNQISTSGALKDRSIDPTDTAEQTLGLQLDLKTKNVYLQPMTYGCIRRSEIEYKVDYR